MQRAELDRRRSEIPALWRRLRFLVTVLDPRDAMYDVREAHHLAVEAFQIVLELEERGEQLALFTPQA